MRNADDEGFERFVRARYPELLRFGRALTGDVDKGADLVQEALVRTLTAWSRVEGRGDPEGYVRRVMVNRNISVWRRLRLDHEARPQLNHVDELDVATRLDIWAAVRELPPRQRTVIALRFFAELPVDQTAALMNCTAGTVKSQTAKAVRRLRLALGGLHEEVTDGPVYD